MRHDEEGISSNGKERLSLVERVEKNISREYLILKS